MVMMPDTLQNMLNPITGPKGASAPSDLAKKTVEIYDTDDDILASASADMVKSILGNWYRQMPYGFSFRGMTFYLPIAPSNLSITTHFATNMITTMYGTVEEHSEQRYYDITISGTTGMSPRYYQEVHDQPKSSVIGRAGFPVKSSIIPSTGFFKRTQALVDNTLNQASDLLGDTQPTTGVDLRKTGYVAFHNFYKFLLMQKKVATGQSTIGEGGKGLTFLNYKDNNQYNVVIQTFQLNRDAANPMLYNYHISMRAYNLRTVDSKDVVSDLTSRASDLGLTGLKTSWGAMLANKARQAKNAAYSAIAAVKGAGS